MNLSTSTCLITNYLGDEEGFKLIKETGFDAVDLSLCEENEERYLGEDYMEHAERLKKLLQKYDLKCNQAHAPYSFTYGNPWNCTDPKYLLTVRALEVAAHIGINHVVVHSCRVPEGVDVLETNIALYKTLYPYCKKFGVKIAIENLGRSIRTVEMFNHVLSALDPEYFVGLVDIGHAVVRNLPPHEFIANVLPGRLQGLHIHDNYGNTDAHMLPGIGITDWDSVINALAQRDYPGDFSLEISSFNKVFGEENIKESLKLAYSVTRKMADRLESTLQAKKA